MTADLFDGVDDVRPAREAIAAGAMLLRGFAQPIQHDLLHAIGCVVEQAPFRHLVTPGGHTMSVAMTNCGSLGWVSDRTGYRYDAIDPDSGTPWPDMPPIFRELAGQAAAQAGFPDFRPEACLVNRYEPGTKLSLHQDRDEENYDAPIVSVSMGLPASRPIVVRARPRSLAFRVRSAMDVSARDQRRRPRASRGHRWNSHGVSRQGRDILRALRRLRTGYGHHV